LDLHSQRTNLAGSVIDNDSFVNQRTRDALAQAEKMKTENRNT
jgi:hypothetical protein